MCVHVLLLIIKCTIETKITFVLFNPGPVSIFFSIQYIIENFFFMFKKHTDIVTIINGYIHTQCKAKQTTILNL